MTYALRYRSTRSEVWCWYWRTWRSRLWRVHVAFAVALGFLLSRLLPGLDDGAGWAAASTIAFAVAVALSVAFSQLAFKSAERALTVDEQGWSTLVGPKAGSRKWSETAPVFEQSGAIVIADKGGNALIIPARAFASTAERDQFLVNVRAWQQHVAEADA